LLLPSFQDVALEEGEAEAVPVLIGITIGTAMEILNA
jgi:hypothetical protein